MDRFPDSIVQFFRYLLPTATSPVLTAFLFLVLAVLAVLLLIPRFKLLRANLVLGIILVALLLLVLATGIPHRWQWIAGLVPTLMVGYQLFYLWLYHPKETSRKPVEQLGGAQQPSTVSEQSYKRAQDTIYNQFSLKTLFTRYGLPAVLLGVTGIVLAGVVFNLNNAFSVLNSIPDGDRAILLRGIRLGAVGAYVYILLELGRRTFRHDITGAIAMWCWVTLILGPVLAGTVAFMWQVPTAGSGSGWWGTGIVLFFTGFAPRRVIGAIEGAAAELLKLGPVAAVKTRLLPLSQIRGIGPQIEERLNEEGISDVNSLATAEPVRLVRNTSFDMRQILNWIDEAILIVTLPRSWEALEEAGITGAIDLAWYSSKMVDPKTGSLINPLPPEITELAGIAKIPVGAFTATIQRLSQDVQVQYIWTLYNNFTEFLGGDHKGGADRDHDEVAGDGIESKIRDLVE